MTDLLLAIGHHLAVFSLIAILAAELVLLVRPVAPAEVCLLARLDIAYGATAVAILALGFARVFFGAKGSAFFLHNPVFWLKIALFGGVGLLSALPTVRFIQWRRRVGRSHDRAPSVAEVASVRRYVVAEMLLFVPIPLLAAAMARGFGLQ